MGLKAAAVITSVVLGAAAGVFTMPALLAATSPAVTEAAPAVIGKEQWHPLDEEALLAGEQQPPPAQVAAWWQGLTAAQQQDAVEESAEVVGNLDGVPYGVRDAVNRARLEEAIRHAEHGIELAPARARVTPATRGLKMLEAIEEALVADQAPARALVSLETDLPGRAAIAVGDLSTADYVGYLVPGMYFSVQNQMVDWTDTAARLARDQTEWLAGESADATVATVAWMGYDTPDLTTFLSTSAAREGATALGRAVTGLDAVRGGDEPYVTVIGHSYGSTAALMALEEGLMSIDALALVGSPGSPASNIAALGIDQVYVGRASWDPVAGSAFYGFDPGAVDFGAVVFGVDGGLDLLSGESLARSVGHNDYFSEGSESLRNLALIGLNQGAAIGEVQPFGRVTQAAE